MGQEEEKEKEEKEMILRAVVGIVADAPNLTMPCRFKYGEGILASLPRA